MLPVDATKEQTVYALTFFLKAGTKVANKMLYATLQMQYVHELDSILQDLKGVAEHIHRIWPTNDTSTVITSANFCRAPRMIHHCLERLYGRLSKLSSPLEFGDYSETVEDIYFTFCGMLESTLELA